MTVAQYQTRFVEFSQHTPYLVEGEPKKIRRFLKGLRPDIRSKLLLLQLTSFVDIAERARILESDANDRKIERSRTQSRPAQSQRQGSNNPAGSTKSGNKNQGDFRRNNFRSRTPNRSGQQNSEGCTFCGRQNHNESECWKKTGKCMRCGSQEHMMRDCPMMRAQAHGQQGGAGVSGSIAAAQP
ncbi:hypothetical protein CFOL_v3_33819 [Cephalotus follicularis]|uniref:CCHC-type domain-containing protein n=1 Tax=Cephalotus follicularis TaxID=3775 RepID=A0A1Q3DD83_CEPFO|nr:hypothetical protein CFOL_v3_33819 [Cephalotus follicularis]